MPRPALVMLGNTSTATALSESCLVPGWIRPRFSSAARALVTSSSSLVPPEPEAEPGPPVLELLPMFWQPARPTPAPSPASTSERRAIGVMILSSLPWGCGAGDGPRAAEDAIPCRGLGPLPARRLDRRPAGTGR